MSWQQDVADIKAWNKKGAVRGIALLYARVVAQIGVKAAAKAVGCSEATVRRYTKTWDMLAEAGLVKHVKDLDADTTYDFDKAGVTEEVWDEVYEEMRYTRKDGVKVSKRQAGLKEVLDAVDSDPAKEAAIREHLGLRMEDAILHDNEQAKHALNALRKRTAAIAARARREAGIDPEDAVLADYEDTRDDLDGTELGNKLAAGAESVARYDALVKIRDQVKAASAAMAELVEEWGQTGDAEELRVVRQIQSHTTDLAIAVETFTYVEVAS